MRFRVLLCHRGELFRRRRKPTCLTRNQTPSSGVMFDAFKPLIFTGIYKRQIVVSTFVATHHSRFNHKVNGATFESAKIAF